VRLDEILLLLFIIIFVIIGVFLVRKFRAKPHKILTRLIATNIVLDIVAIAIWAFPETQWSVYRLGFAVAILEAGIAVAVFIIVLFGLKKNKPWAPLLAIALTVVQRVFATYIFFPSPALALTLVWSIMIIMFAIMDIRAKKATGTEGFS
jgi:hypothetical protein